MPLNMNEFKSEVSRRGGLARESHFRVLITGGVLKTSSARALAFLVHGAQIPARMLATADIYTHGPQVKHPYLNIYDDMSLNIRCLNGNLFPRDLFDEWQNMIVSSYNNRVNYFDQYVCDMEIEQYDERENVTFAVKLIDAYPIQVAPMTLDHGSTNYHNLNVMFAYRRWQMQPLPLTPFGNNLAINALYPNFDFGGLIDQFGMGVVNRADGQFLTGVQKGGSFLTNIV